MMTTTHSNSINKFSILAAGDNNEFNARMMNEEVVATCFGWGANLRTFRCVGRRGLLQLTAIAHKILTLSALSKHR